MLKIESTRILTSMPVPLSSTVASIMEGVVAIGVMENGVMCAKPSAGNTGEVVLGIAMSQVMNPTVAPKVEEFTIPATPFQITLSKTPLNAATQIGVQVIDSSGNYVSNMTYIASSVVTGRFISTAASRVITFAAADTGLLVRVTYTYAPTLVEAAMIYGQGIGDAAQSAINSVSVVTNASILFTDQYDPSDNWSIGGPVYTQANGLLTLKTSGTLLPTVKVMQAPGIGTDGFLGVFFSS